MFPHNFIPTLLVVFIPGESIDKELLGVPSVPLHSFLDEVDSNLDWNNLALKDDAVNQIAIWGATVSLSNICLVEFRIVLTSSLSRSPADK